MQVEDWLRTLDMNNTLSATGRRIIQAAVENPERAAFASSGEFAQVAGVNVASVTRAAQALNFSGWPEFRQEIRARYLQSLSAAEVASVHLTAEPDRAPAEGSLFRSFDNMRQTHKRFDRALVQALARKITAAPKTIIVASGSFAGVGQSLAHNLRLAGVPAVLASDEATISSLMPLVNAGDVIVVISFWRLYKSAVFAARLARKNGGWVVALTDSASNSLSAEADQKLIVPAEGTAHFPSLVAALAIAECICAETAASNKERSTAAIASAESGWTDYGILYEA